MLIRVVRAVNHFIFLAGFSEKSFTMRLQVISKPKLLPNCHSERSEESHLFSELRSFTPFQDDKKTGFEMACSQETSVPG